MFVGYDKPYWVNRGGMFDGGVCTCQEVWDDYCAFRKSMEFGPVAVDGDRARKQRSDRFDVSEDELKKHVRWLAGRARERTTSAMYAKFWNSVVLKHCRWKQLNPWALSSGDVANLLAWHEMQGKAGEIERLYNSMRVVYASRDLTLPASPLAKEIVKGAARVHAEEKGDVTREGFPMSAFRDLCEQPELYVRPRTGVRDRAVIGLGLRCMRRPSELSKLRRKHVCWAKPTANNWVDPPGAHPLHIRKWLKVYIRSQKNDKKAKGQWIFIEPTWSVSCPVRLLVTYCEEFGVVLGESASGEEPLFTSLTEEGVALSPGAINSVVKKAAVLLDLEAHVTGHSLRIGGATAAAAAGLGLEIIRSIGGWFGDAVFGYIRAAAAPAMKVSSLMGF